MAYVARATFKILSELFRASRTVFFRTFVESGDDDERGDGDVGEGECTCCPSI